MFDAHLARLCFCYIFFYSQLVLIILLHLLFTSSLPSLPRFSFTILSSSFLPSFFFPFISSLLSYLLFSSLLFASLLFCPFRSGPGNIIFYLRFSSSRAFELPGGNKSQKKSVLYSGFFMSIQKTPLEDAI